MKLVLSLYFSLFSVVVLVGEGTQPDLPSEPEVWYIFPLGGQQGSNFQIEVEGQALDGTYAVWTDCQKLQVRVRRVAEVKIYLKPDGLQSGHRVTLDITASPDTLVGGHTLKLISPRGISNSFPLRISPGSETMVTEIEDQTAQGQPVEAQQVSFPVAINGRLGRVLGGEIDYYEFQVNKGEELFFEIFSPAGKGNSTRAQFGKMLLYLYKRSASWVDSHRLVQLAFNDDPVGHEHGLFALEADAVRSRLTYRFKKKGNYLAAVKSFDDRGGPNFVYQLRIVTSSEASVVPRDNKAWPLAHTNAQEWEEREFEREIKVSRLKEIRSRTVNFSGNAGDSSSRNQFQGEDGDLVTRQQSKGRKPVSLFFHRIEDKYHETIDQARPMDIPTLVEGSISHPGKTNYFKFDVKEGQKLVLEVQTSDARPPMFNPWLRVLNSQGEVVFTNIYNRVEGNNVMLFRYLEPKVIYTFKDSDKYTLEVRDLTTKYGDPAFNYRLLVRSQIPHLGNFEVDASQLNLVPGQARRLMLTSEREEGFEGDIAYSLENLPDGIRALAGVADVEDRPAPFDEGEKERFRPDSQEVAIVLLADSGAPVTRMPKLARIVAHPIVEGQPGMPLFVANIPIMVVQMAKQEEPSQRDVGD